MSVTLKRTVQEAAVPYVLLDRELLDPLLTFVKVQALHGEIDRPACE